MVARNEITGDLIKTKVNDDQKYKDNFDKIDFSIKLEDENPKPKGQMDLFDEEQK